MRLVSGFSREFFKFLMIFLVLAVTFLVYVPSLSNGFVNWDDDVHLLENRFIRSLDWSDIPEIFTTTVNLTYIPLTTLSFAIEYQFFGFDPFYYHLNNLILHVLVTALVMILALRLGFSTVAAAAAGLIFGIHPVHVESVAWVTERKDVLFAFFYLLSVLVYLRYLKERSGLLLFISILCGLLSVLSKSMALSLPLILLLCDWYMLKKIAWRDIFNKFYYSVLFIPLVWVTFFSNSAMLKAHAGTDVFLWMWCFNFYLWKFIAPGQTVLFYDVPYPVTLANAEYLIHATLFVVLWAVLWFKKNDKVLLFAFLFYAASIFFVLRFHVSLDTVMDRFMYLPSVGWCFYIGVAFERLLLFLEKKKVMFCVMIFASLAVTGSLMVNTSRRIAVWSDSKSLWQNQLRNSQAAGWLARAKLGDAYFQEALQEGVFTRLSRSGESQENAKIGPEIKSLKEPDERRLSVILGLYQKSIQEKPDYAQPYFQLGVVYELLMDIPQAVFFYEQASRLNEKNFMALIRLGHIYAGDQKALEAVEFYQRAIKINPYNQEIRLEIAGRLKSLVQEGDPTGVYQKALDEVQSLRN